MHQATTRRRPTVRRLLLLAASALAGMAVLAGPAAAQSPPPTGATGGPTHSWALAPALAEGATAGRRPNLSYDLAPGAETEDSVTLFNLGNVQLTFEIYSAGAVNNERGDFDLPPSDEEPRGVGTWVTLPQERITVPAGKQVTFPIKIKVPQDARPGDHAGAVLAASVATGTGADGKVVSVERRTGTRLYVRVDGPLQPRIAVEGLHTTYTHSLNPLGGRAEVSYRIHNRGNVRLAGSHQITVAGPMGIMKRSSSSLELTELLPGESVQITRTITGVAAPGLAFTEVEVDAGLVEAESRTSESASARSFTLAPPVAVLAGLLVVGLLWYARRAHVRRRRPALAGMGG